MESPKTQENSTKEFKHLPVIFQLKDIELFDVPLKIYFDNFFNLVFLKT